MAPLTCELCGKSEVEADIGDWNGVVCCTTCAEAQPELMAWKERMDAWLNSNTEESK